MKFQTENWIHILNNCNSILDNEEDDIDCSELNKSYLDRSITKIKTFPQSMYNLPNDKRLVDQLLDYENRKIEYIPWQIGEMFKEMPFKWLSKVSDRFRGDDIIIIDEPDDLPQSIRKYVQKFYVKHFDSAGFGLYISTKRYSAINKNLGFEDFLKYLESTKSTFSISESDYIDLSTNSVYLFNGIDIKNFYFLYFKSGLSKECIFRFLRNNEFAYSIDYQAIEKEVERILNKH